MHAVITAIGNMDAKIRRNLPSSYIKVESMKLKIRHYSNIYTLKILTPLDAHNISSNQKAGHAAATALHWVILIQQLIRLLLLNSEVSECQFA